MPPQRGQVVPIIAGREGGPSSDMQRYEGYAGTAGAEPHAEATGLKKHTGFVGLDVHKDQISVAVAESGGAVEYLGQIANDPAAISKLRARLARPSAGLSFCYEAGPRGYGLHRQLTNLGIAARWRRRPSSPPNRVTASRPTTAMPRCWPASIGPGSPRPSGSRMRRMKPCAT